jgi:hypothetical protein
MVIQVPIRLVDGEGIWESDKLAGCRDEFVPHYALLLPLALANGSFECNPVDITRRVYGKVMPSITRDQVELILAEFQRAKLLFTWRTPDEKLWGYWTGIERRLPAQSHVRRGNYGIGAPVPVGPLAEFLGREVEDLRWQLGMTAAVVDRQGVSARAGEGPNDDRTISGKDEVRNRSREGKEAETGASAPVSSSAPTAPPLKLEQKGKKIEEQSLFFSKQEKARSAEPERVEPKRERVSANYSLFEVAYRAACGRLPGGNPAKRKRYTVLCAEFGEKAVLDAVVSWASQRGGPAKLAKNDFAAWDFLDEKAGECRAEILGGRGKSGGDGFKEKMKKHRQRDEKTERLLNKQISEVDSLIP